MGLLRKVRELFASPAEKEELKKPIILGENSSFSLTESFRSLKAALSVSVPRSQGKGLTLLCTSSFPSEGKTTVSVNLAYIFASPRKKVILVDADLRKGSSSAMLGLDGKEGLSDFLSGKTKLEDVIIPTGTAENCFIIPRGSKTPRPYDLLDSYVMKDLLETLKEQFDYVLIDTPPIQIVPDALALAPQADGTFLIARHYVSYENDIKKSVEKLQFFKANILGIVVNGYEAQRNSAEYNSSYKYYRYSYHKHGKYSGGKYNRYYKNYYYSKPNKAEKQEQKEEKPAEEQK